MRYLIIDLYSQAGVHERVNNAVLEYFDQNLELCSFVLVANYCPSDLKNVKYIKIPDVFFNRNNRVLMHLLRDVFLPLILLPILLRYAFSRKVLLGFSTLQTLTFLPLFAMFQSSVLFHSQLELISPRPETRSLRYIVNYLCGHIIKFYCVKKSIRKLFLSKHISSSLSSIEVQFSNCFFINHPVELSDIARYDELCMRNALKTTDQNIVIGSVGLFREDTKKSSFVYKLAEANSALDFKLVGRAGPGFCFREDLVNVRNVKFTSLVSYESLIEEASDITHLVYYFSPDSYKFTASGTLVDAMCLNKRIIVNRDNSVVDQMSELNISTYENFKSKFDIKTLEKPVDYTKQLQGRYLSGPKGEGEVVKNWLNY